ncbi:hypothetical protein GCM10017783_13730 [Deinococcus piscis]|uniref:histidine kinase n=1 Tax=Deinococcus piscis TaxID=394230 RepID=A0ABQ3K543_9DEIO|nr:ATP-binding protein [Deinococcus piscis]GHG02720.1 hypothetical protein GCM10017783_13730 [Deinococcus piscis]
MAAVASLSQDTLAERLSELAHFDQPGALLAAALATLCQALGASAGAAFLAGETANENYDSSEPVAHWGQPEHQHQHLPWVQAAAGMPVWEAGWAAFPLSPSAPANGAAPVLALLVLEWPQQVGTDAGHPSTLTPGLSALLTVAALALDRLLQQAEMAKLRVRSQRAQQLLQASPVAMAAGALDGTLAQVNDAYLHLLGYTRSEFETGDMDWAALTPPEYQQGDAEAFARAFAEGKSGWYEKEMLNAQGERIPLSVALFRHDDEETLVVGYLRDLREQRALEQAQASVTAELRGMLEQQGLTLAQLAAQLQQQNEELEARSRVLEGMAQLVQDPSLETDPYSLIHRAQVLAQQLLPQGYAVYYEPSGGLWRLKSQVGSVGNDELQKVLDAGIPFETTHNLITPWRSHQSYFQDAYNHSADGLEEVTAQLQATATIPVLTHGTPRGIFAFGLNVKQRWTDTEKVILESLAAQLGLVLERLEQTRMLVERSRELERTNSALEARTRALEGFAELSRDLTLEHDPLMLIGRVQELLVSLLPGSVSTYYELDTPAAGGLWHLRSYRGEFPDNALLHALKRGLPYSQTIILDRPYHAQEPFYQDVYDPSTNPSVDRRQTGRLRTSGSFPVRTSDTVRGVLVVGRFRPSPWTPADRTLLETVLFSLQLALERAEQTQALQRHAQELEKSNAELERFAFIASHDLQEPLRTVTIQSERLLDSLDHPSEAQQRYGGYIRDNIQRMQSLLHDLRSFTELGRRLQEPREVELSRKVDYALQELQRRVESSGAKVTLDGPLPAVLGDPDQVQELLTRLLDNALKFTAQGAAPEIRISAQQADGWVEVSVQDSGIGIAPEHFEQIFTVFQRLHGRERYSGNGIGLSVARRIAELHGGRLWVESHPGQGSTFRFTLPAASQVAVN